MSDFINFICAKYTLDPFMREVMQKCHITSYLALLDLKDVETIKDMEKIIYEDRESYTTLLEFYPRVVENNHFKFVGGHRSIIEGLAYEAEKEWPDYFVKMMNFELPTVV